MDSDCNDLSLYAVRRRLLLSKLDRLRSKIHQLIRAINKPLADVIRDHALPHLPVRSLLRLRSVSSSWNSVISAPLFSLTHSLTPRSPSGLFSSSPLCFLPFDPDSHSLPDPCLSFLDSPQIALKSSSNGLLLCLLPRHYVVCNPSTMQWTPLPQSNIDHGSNPNAVLVFNPSVLNCGSDYFVVVAFEISGASGVFGFDVFSSASGTWRASHDICFAEEILNGSGISAGDVACWRTSMQTVVIFDPTADAARVVVWPLGYRQQGTWELAAVNGDQLCCVSVTQKHVSVFVLWRGSEYSWVPHDCLVSAGCGGMWKWLKQGIEDMSGEVLLEEFRPSRSQSGNLDVVLLADSEAVVLDLVGRRVRDRRNIPAPGTWETDFVVHVNTLAPVFPQASDVQVESKLHKD